VTLVKAKAAAVCTVAYALTSCLLLLMAGGWAITANLLSIPSGVQTSLVVGGLGLAMQLKNVPKLIRALSRLASDADKSD
jgi:hypothetical protein